MRSSLLFCVLVLCLFAFETDAQTSARKVKLIHTDELRYDRAMVSAQRLIGHVHLELDGTQFFCDSAYLYANDDFDAYGHIRIVEGNGSTVFSDALHFEKARNTAFLNGNVTMRDEDITLTSSELTYQVRDKIARYHTGGRIVSSSNKNTLTSRHGTFNGKTEDFYFKHNVVLNNPTYTVRSDTMNYKSATELTTFLGPTYIEGDSVLIYCETGYYNTKKDESRFGKNAWVRDGSTILKGDSIYFNNKMGVGEVFRNVMVRDTTQTFEIRGNYARHVQKPEVSIVTDRALLLDIMNGDTLFMHADTLKASTDGDGSKRIFAYQGVRIFKNDLQGLCDSAVYLQRDSMMWMYRKPIVWSAQNQVTGDTLKLGLSGNVLSKAWVMGSAFIVSDAEGNDTVQGPEIRFNQIKGKSMTAIFRDNDLQSVWVDGNGELVYYPTDEKGLKPRALGTNQGECSSIFIRFREGELSTVRMEGNPKSVFKSNKFAGNEPMKLRDFQWLRDRRPRSREDIFLK
jgi:lipopolysaccharide export system protein LptA